MPVSLPKEVPFGLGELYCRWRGRFRVDFVRIPSRPHRPCRMQWTAAGSGVAFAGCGSIVSARHEEGFFEVRESCVRSMRLGSVNVVNHVDHAPAQVTFFHLRVEVMPMCPVLSILNVTGRVKRD